MRGVVDRIRVDPKLPVNGRREVLGGEDSVNRRISPRVGGANDLTSRSVATGEHD